MVSSSGGVGAGSSLTTPGLLRRVLVLKGAIVASGKVEGHAVITFVFMMLYYMATFFKKSTTQPVWPGTRSIITIP